MHAVEWLRQLLECTLKYSVVLYAMHCAVTETK